MLQVQNLQSLDDGERRGAPKQASLDDLIAAAFGIVRRQYRIVGLFALIGLVCGALYLLMTPRVYTAQAELLFDRGNRPVVSQQPVLIDTPFDASFFESQIKLIESDATALAVVKKLGLAKMPEFTSSGAGMFASIMGIFRSSGPKSKGELEESAASALAQKITAKRIGITFFVEISYQDTNATLAEKIVNAVAEAYINGQQESRRLASRQANDWLKGRLDELRRNADNDEQAVNEYKATHNIVKSGGTSIGEQAVAALNVEIVQARAKASEASARFDRIESALRSKGGDLPVDATVVDTLNNPIITKLRQEYLSLASKEAEYAARFGGQHLAVVGIRSKMKAAEVAMYSELKRFAAIARSEYEIAKARQDNLERELRTSVSQSQATDRAQVKLRDLETAQQNSRALYTTFQQRYLEASQQQATSISDVQLVAPATATNQKRGPKVLAISIFGGLALGAALGFFREASDRVFRTSKQVEDILGLPCVGLIPLLSQHAVAQPISAAKEGLALRSITYRSPLMDTFLRDPFSPTAEALRSIKLAADLHVKSTTSDEARKKGSIIGICSALSSEGKSTLSIALSELAARVGNKVIVVDCDLRHPSTSRKLAPNASVGLAEVLSNECALDMAIWTDPATGMAVLPILQSIKPIDPYQLFSSAAADRLFKELKARYEYIILDLPCMLNVIDVQATGNVADLFFLVLEWGHTKISLIERVLSSSAAISEKIVGVVLNKADIDYIVRYNSYDYKKYYDTEA